MAVKKTKKQAVRTFKNREIANTDFEFIGLGNQHSDIKLIDIDNPHYSKRHAGASGNPSTVRAAMNLRESPIAMMAAKGHLEKHQLEAANRFRRTWEALGGAGAGSFDYTREPVDGGGARESITDRQVDAGKVLKQCQEVLGPRHYDVVCKVAGEGRTIAELCASKREKLTLADYLRHALDDLAVHWGLQKRKTPSNEPPVGLSR
jgi:hypothetical protein